MSPLALSFLFVFLSSFFFLFIISSAKTSKNGKKLPPGPKGLPIIGSLHILGSLPHRTFCQLAKKYGPIMSMRLGSVPTIIISSPKTAELVLKTHDSVFASRPKTQSSEIFSYGSKAIVLTPYGPSWRDFRKLSNLHLLSSSKIESFEPTRTKEIGLIVERLNKCALKSEVVNLSKLFSELIENMTYRMVVGRVKYDDLSLKENIHEMARLSGAFNIADFVPFLAPFDLQGLTKQIKALSKKTDVVLGKIIRRHEQDYKSISSEERDFVDVLLSRMNKPMNPVDEYEQRITESHIKSIILDMFAASLDTSSTATEWTFSELLRHPDIMLRLKEEIKSVVGKDQMVKESDLPKLTYLDMVIKESLRLHPVVCLLVPHESIEDTTVGEYFIPKKSRVLVNLWTIGRDKDVWGDNADEFMPARFADNGVDFRSNHFSLISFGYGRRGCAGIQLGLIYVKFVVAQLVHCFDWELPDGTVPEKLDMLESFGLTLPRANSLFAKPTARLCSY